MTSSTCCILSVWCFGTISKTSSLAGSLTQFGEREHEHIYGEQIRRCHMRPCHQDTKHQKRASATSRENDSRNNQICRSLRMIRMVLCWLPFFLPWHVYKETCGTDVSLAVKVFNLQCQLGPMPGNCGCWVFEYDCWQSLLISILSIHFPVLVGNDWWHPVAVLVSVVRTVDGWVALFHPDCDSDCGEHAT